MQKQLTLKQSFTLKGKGLHTGGLITAVFAPASENFGYKIQNKRNIFPKQYFIECADDHSAGDRQIEEDQMGGGEV